MSVGKPTTMTEVLSAPSCTTEVMKAKDSSQEARCCAFSKVGPEISQWPSSAAERRT